MGFSLDRLSFIAFSREVGTGSRKKTRQKIATPAALQNFKRDFKRAMSLEAICALT
jgi:hypothetical protein